jgi:hypothetical protein
MHLEARSDPIFRLLRWHSLKVSNIFCAQTVGYIIFSDIISLQLHPGVQAVPGFELVKPLQEHARPGARGGAVIYGNHLFADVVWNHLWVHERQRLSARLKEKGPYYNKLHLLHHIDDCAYHYGDVLRKVLCYGMRDDFYDEYSLL